MAAKKTKSANNRNRFPIFPLRADEAGQMEHWKAFAKRAGTELSALIREVMDRHTGRKK
jgi:hypothetical protein